MAIEPLLASRAQKAFIGTISIQGIVVLVMIAVTFRMVDNEVNLTAGYKTLPCYLALFALGEIFELLMAFDALRLRNVIQLVGILMFHLCMMVFAAIQVRQTKTSLVTMSDSECSASFNSTNCDGDGSLWNRIEPLLIVAPVVIGVSWLLILFYVKQLYEEFGWAIFHIVGANPKMKSMYQWYQIMICLLKFDFFFFTGVTMQLLILVLSTESAEFGVTIAAIPIVLTLLALCGFAVQREIKWIMSVSLVLMLAAESYFIYKLVRFYQPSSRDLYSTTRATLTTFTIVAFLLLFATFAVGLRCFADFDRGLQDSKVNGQYTPVATKMDILNGKGTLNQKQSSYLGGSAMQQRISIE
ncbi:hypothetical protein CYLTODRAFT_435870 [Cylindrobasidium torrendii FP15055 ss-10]|uniref:Uncharacterized protein n=1 Tax=Cylindrobasidium torrendii FP15055 ss-10 TaxID=1314674 RepID=A0A0D7BIA7_9AGAR|nr:hypothetical protein CYLTODRAFT_435870 [Cylindrobasidium torrendii FP15055 ss-10]